MLVLLATAALAGDYQQARAYQEEMLAITEPSGEAYFRSTALMNGGLVAWLEGNLTQAAPQVLDSLRITQEHGLDDRYVSAMSLEVLAWITASMQQHRRAATLLGAADTLWTGLGTQITSYPHLVGYHNECQRRVRAALGDAAHDEAFHHGQALSNDAAIPYALGERPPPTVAPPSDTSTPLTRREQQIADLIAQGLSNKEIANRLVISQRTAESHVEHILTKLSLSNRVQVAAWKAAQKSGDQDS